ncbi:ferrochelatase [Methylomarinum sp. Ch1-1]|uniref:Ferrochelatase n=1 Tax=Methylomarinum roseum TaxID=3067653 RepID=A0AAU7NS17_9GAMM|nr:ferrochelatase [Methylomarinum sp. Ch1-1]MDP4520243.1 ferrochelatase [Methylomarinum sp. Ch1-1]
MAQNPGKKVGVLLVNLGSPDAPTTSRVRRFLREFLGDPRVVNLPRALWWVILNFFVLPFRPRKSARAYREIWTDKGSPLVYYTRQLSDKLAIALDSDEIHVDYAMRYGKPVLADKLNAFKAQMLDEIIILPLYPQYSSTTTASVYDAVDDVVRPWRHIPSLQFIAEYHDHQAYIAAVAESIKAFWHKHGRNDLLLMSFHGLPAKLTDLGDPYYHHCQKTAALIAERLGLHDTQWKLVFQSRFGKAEWLKPYCLEVLQDLPQQGSKEVDIVCPGFAVDCLETLEEIALANKEEFLAAGGKSYRYIPALNDSDEHVKVMVDLLSRRLR